MGDDQHRHHQPLQGSPQTPLLPPLQDGQQERHKLHLHSPLPASQLEVAGVRRLKRRGSADSERVDVSEPEHDVNKCAAGMLGVTLAKLKYHLGLGKRSIEPSVAFCVRFAFTLPNQDFTGDDDNQLLTTTHEAGCWMVAGRRYSRLTLAECSLNQGTCELKMPLSFQHGLDEAVRMHRQLHNLASSSDNHVVFKVAWCQQVLSFKWHA